MEKRHKDLLDLKSFSIKFDKDMTMILQSLQWDRKETQGTASLKCKYDSGHRIPPDKVDVHEQRCFLARHGYNKKDLLLPDPVDPNANTLVRLKNAAIAKIIEDSSKLDPLFKKVGMSNLSMILPTLLLIGGPDPQPLTLERLQSTFSPDERRAIHDAVVQAAPFCHDLLDLALPSDDAHQSNTNKSRLEILAELRNMKRRRTKYRVAAKTRNYSDVLRDVIKTQMELYTEAKLKNSTIDRFHNKDTGKGNNEKYRNSSTSSRSHWDSIMEREKLREETPLLDEPKLRDKILHHFPSRQSMDRRGANSRDKRPSRNSEDHNKSRQHYKERERSHSKSRRYFNEERKSDVLSERSVDGYKRNNVFSTRERSKQWSDSEKGGNYKRYYDNHKEAKEKRK